MPRSWRRPLGIKGLMLSNLRCMQSPSVLIGRRDLRQALEEAVSRWQRECRIKGVRLRPKLDKQIHCLTTTAYSQGKKRTLFSCEVAANARPFHPVLPATQTRDF